MITSNFYIDDGVYSKGEVLWGKSTDTKSTSVPNGSAFIEMDTSKVYFFDGANSEWLEWGAESDSESVEASALSVSRPAITLGNSLPNEVVENVPEMVDGGEDE